MLVFNTFFH